MVKFQKLTSVGQAKDYFKKDFANERENYYSKDGDRTAEGTYTGDLAAEMGLHGQCTQEQYERLIAGQHPLTGEQLVANVDPRAFINKRGEQDMTKGRVPGIDLNFAMPKSFSGQAIYGKDERFYQWHREAKAEALAFVERYALAHMGGSNAPQRTGKLLIVEFDHNSARPVNGVASPHIHTHAVAINLQRTEDGKWHALQNEEMMRIQRLEKEIYFAALEAKAQRGGYDTYRGKYEEPELKGISREWIEDVSLRRGKLEDAAGEMGLDLDDASKSHAAIMNTLAKSNRESKQSIDRDKTELFMAQKNAEHQCAFEERTALALVRGERIVPEQQRLRATQKAVDYARDNRLERSATVCEDHLYQDALERARGTGVIFRDVVQDVAQRKESGEFVIRRAARTTDILTTRQEIQKEEESIAIMQRGQGRIKPISGAPDQALEKVSEAPELQQTGKPFTPNEGQERVFRQILSNPDQVQAVQGDAGTGKTYLLRGVRIAAEQAGYQVKGFGTTGRNTYQLGESGIQVETLQSHLHKGEKAHETTGKLLYVMDESSLASSRDVNTLLSRLQDNERVLMVGDTGQHQSVDAGKAFEQLQEAGMHTAHLDQIVRQKNELLREIATDLAARRTDEAFEKLQNGGFIHEIRDPQQRLKAITDDVLRHREQAREQHPGDAARQTFVLVTPQNDRKQELNQAIRKELQERNEVSKDDHTIKVLEPRQDVTDTQKKWAAKYETGDTVRYFKNSPKAGIQKDDYARIVAKNVERNTITVELLTGQKAGRQIEYDPARRSGVEVFRESERAFATGDSVQFTAKWQDQGINRREMGTVQAIDDQGNLHIRLEGGRDVKFNTSEFRHLEHGYCTTSHGAQGLTAGYSGGDFPTIGKNPDLINPRSFYVSFTRCMHGNGMYTDDVERLKELFNRSVTNETAIDAEKYRQPELAEHSAAAPKVYRSAAQELREFSDEMRTNAYEDLPRRSAAQELADTMPEAERLSHPPERLQSPRIAQEPAIEPTRNQAPAAALSRNPGGNVEFVPLQAPEGKQSVVPLCQEVTLGAGAPGSDGRAFRESYDRETATQAPQSPQQSAKAVPRPIAVSQLPQPTQPARELQPAIEKPAAREQRPPIAAQQQQPPLQGARLKIEDGGLRIIEATPEQQARIHKVSEEHVKRLLGHLDIYELSAELQKPAVIRQIDTAIIKELQAQGAHVATPPERAMDRPAQFPVLYSIPQGYAVHPKTPVQDRERFRQEVVEPAKQKLIAGKSPQETQRVTSSIERMNQTGVYTGEVGEAVRKAYTQKTHEYPRQIEPKEQGIERGRGVTLAQDRGEGHSR